MTQASQGAQTQPSQNTELKTDSGTLFGIPLGNLGWFTSLLIGLAAGFIAFFAATFIGIVSILVYNSTTHHTVDLALSYKLGGLSVGAVVMVAALGYLGTLWVRRIARKS